MILTYEMTMNERFNMISLNLFSCYYLWKYFWFYNNFLYYLIILYYPLARHWRYLQTLLNSKADSIFYKYFFSISIFSHIHYILSSRNTAWNIRFLQKWQYFILHINWYGWSSSISGSAVKSSGIAYISFSGWREGLK